MSVSLPLRIFRSAGKDRVGGVAAELAFFLLLSIPPAILILAGFAGYVGKLFGPDAQATLQRGIVNGLGTFLAPDTMRDFVRPAVDDLFARGRADILSVGAVGVVVLRKHGPVRIREDQKRVEFEPKALAATSQTSFWSLSDLNLKRSMSFASPMRPLMTSGTVTD